jgi:hypothetical protein
MESAACAFRGGLRRFSFAATRKEPLQRICVIVDRVFGAPEQLFISEEREIIAADLPIASRGEFLARETRFRVG